MGLAASRWALVPVTATVLLAGCGVSFKAPRLVLILHPAGIVYASAQGDEQLVGGETVFEIANSTRQERQVVLAHVADGTSDVPVELIAADLARDDDRILGFSQVLEPEETDFASGGEGMKTDRASFHVYLRPGDTYVLFDRLSHTGKVPGERLVLWLHPAEQDS